MVVVTLTVLFGIVARKDKIFKVRIDLVSEGKKVDCFAAMPFCFLPFLYCFVGLLSVLENHYVLPPALDLPVDKSNIRYSRGKELHACKTLVKIPLGQNI